MSKFPLSASLRVPTDLSALARVLDWFDGLESPIVPQRIWLQLKTALAEAFTNAVRHAHQGESALTVEIHFEQTAEFLRLKVIDCGPRFDLEAKLQDLPDVDLNATGGRGLRLMDCIADELCYTRLEDNRNCLSLLKRYQIQSGS
ncbi:ATP-binding protein [Phormidium yuhuli AB48]|uniref:ATP-binding protein n=1 Tax=Phormidium yuhuli AB48 TaxID=2940671 RepID=A0ABY5AQT8_9CYAN|nr:ATP-binding protein [Phormidium yuhuli]USR91587.1 ATP-binding protein [Phormidium yuhuli AB48]